MLYRIADLSVDARSGHTCIEVEFWQTRADYLAGKPAVVVNDFYNNYRGDATVPYVDGLGRRRFGGIYAVPYFEKDGEWVQRTGWDTYPAPLASMIHDDLLRWWQGVGQAKRADCRDPAFVKAAEGVDPLSALARPDVQALKGRVWTDEV